MLLLKNRGCLWAESMHKSSETGGLQKLLKWGSYIDVWPFSVRACCFPMHLYGPHTFVCEKWWQFQTIYPLKPLIQYCSKFMWSLLGTGERKISKLVAVHWQRWPPCQYRVKALKNRGCLGAKSSGTKGLPKMQNEGRKLMTFHLCTERSSLLPYAFARPHIFVWQNIENFKRLLLWSRLANVAQILCEAQLGQGYERLLKLLRSIDQDGRHGHIW